MKTIITEFESMLEWVKDWKRNHTTIEGNDYIQINYKNGDSPCYMHDELSEYKANLNKRTIVSIEHFAQGIGMYIAYNR